MNPVKTVTTRSNPEAAFMNVTMSPSYLLVPGSSSCSGKGVLVYTSYPLPRSLSARPSMTPIVFFFSSSDLTSMEFPYGFRRMERGPCRPDLLSLSLGTSAGSTTDRAGSWTRLAAPM